MGFQVKLFEANIKINEGLHVYGDHTRNSSPDKNIGNKHLDIG